MVSFDVKSLFTNVPVSECVQFLKEKLPTTNLNIPFSNSIFIQLLELCVSDCFFSFNNEFYNQIYGLPMGSPISPVLANIYMEFLESRLLPTVSGSIIEWCRFVDDVYAIVPDTLNIDEFLVKLNDFNPNIKFTLEIENNGELPFLDVLLIRNSSQHLDFKVYRKPTHSNSYIHAFSKHSSKIKLATISNIFLRAYNICSSMYIDDEIEYIFKSFSRLGYNFKTISNAHFKARKTYFNVHDNNSNNDFKNFLVLIIWENLSISQLLIEVALH